MTEFTQALDHWGIFYSTVALASVTLAGLLFVSISIRQEQMKEEAFRGVVNLARGSFGDFLYVLMLGLVFLVPHPAPIGLAVALFVLGLSRMVGIVRQAAIAVQSAKTGDRTHGMRRIALPAIASFVLVVVGIEVLRGELVAIYGLVIVVAALLSSASWNAWLILVAGDKELSRVAAPES
ncbi:MAG: hypothetical protein ACK2T2_03435 [Anaerolineales bacterium]|jgi:hypothetical protein